MWPSVSPGLTLAPTEVQVRKPVAAEEWGCVHCPPSCRHPWAALSCSFLISPQTHCGLPHLHAVSYVVPSDKCPSLPGQLLLTLRDSVKGAVSETLPWPTPPHPKLGFPLLCTPITLCFLPGPYLLYCIGIVPPGCPLLNVSTCTV